MTGRGARWVATLQDRTGVGVPNVMEEHDQYTGGKDGREGGKAVRRKIESSSRFEKHSGPPSRDEDPIALAHLQLLVLAAGELGLDDLPVLLPIQLQPDH
jgi:hypothetical protein